MRFQLNDIVIKTPGVQLRERILEQYGSIKNFADAIGLYESSITQYLSSKKLGSSTFKIRTMNAFKTDFNDLYKSDAEQIRYFTDLISWYIDKYVYKKDLEILDRVKMLALERGLYEDYAIICRAYAHYYMNQGKVDRAQAYIDVALNSVKDRDNIDRIGLYIGDQILMKAKDMTRNEFKKALDEFYDILDRISGPLTNGHMRMRLGKVYYRLGIYDESRKLFNEVLNYHKDARSRSFVYMWLGDVEKKVFNYDKALNYYREAEKLIDDKDDVLYYVYDEYALYYLNKGNLEKAEHFIDTIFDDPNWKISATKHAKLRTYILVKKACNKEEEIVTIIDRLLEEIKDGYIYNFHHFAIAGEVLQDTELKNETLKAIGRDIISFSRSHEMVKEDQQLIQQLLGCIALNKHFYY